MGAISRHIALTSEQTSTSGYPQLALVGNDSLWITWQTWIEGHHDEIYIGHIENGRIVEAELLSNPSHNGFRPFIREYQDKLWVGWTEFANNRAELWLALFDKGQVVSKRKLRTAENIGSAAWFKDEKNLLGVIWTEEEGQRSDIYLCQNIMNDGEFTRFTETGQAYRPQAIVGGDGRLWVGYEVYNENTYDLAVQVRTSDGGWSDVQRVHDAPEYTNSWATGLQLVPHREGVTGFWYDMAEAAQVSFWRSSWKWNSQSNEIQQFPVECFQSSHQWYMSWFAISLPDYCSLLIYNWGWDIHARKYEEHASTEPVNLSYSGDNSFDRRPHAVVDSRGVAYVCWQHAPANGHNRRNSDIRLVSVTLEDLKLLGNPGDEQDNNSFLQPPKIRREAVVASHDANASLKNEEPYSDLSLFWGDIHGHSALSDALGEVDQYFHAAKVRGVLDFVALTNHDNFPDMLTPAEWDYTRHYVEAFNEPEMMVTLHAFEWTSNEFQHDYGHKNVYFRGSDGTLLYSARENGKDPESLFRGVEKLGGMCFPHHPSADWEIVSAATDWKYHEPKIQRNVEIFSRHGQFECNGDQSHFTRNVRQIDGKSVGDALRLGYQLGIIAGSDSHQLEPGREGGIIGLYAHKLTREEIFDALHERRVYATTGARIRLFFSINGQPMGSKAVVTPTGMAECVVRIHGTDVIRKVDIVGGGAIVASYQPNSREFFRKHAWAVPVASYCYIRVEQSDGHRAWSSPIWIN